MIFDNFDMKSSWVSSVGALQADLLDLFLLKAHNWLYVLETMYNAVSAQRQKNCIITGLPACSLFWSLTHAVNNVHTMS